MALVHEKLYKGKSLSRVDLKEYLTDLGNLLKSINSANAQFINITFDLETIESLIDIALPCGLIVNELLSNSLKHAFKDGTSGEIALGLHRKGGGLIELTISDNGVGLPVGFDIHNATTPGMRLVLQIAKRQLRGDVSVESNFGTHWRITIQENVYTERV